MIAITIPSLALAAEVLGRRRVEAERRALETQAQQVQKLESLGMLAGGIASADDVLEFVCAGARAVQVGTANFWDPASPLRIARELEAFCRAEHIERVSDLVGTLKM